MVKFEIGSPPGIRCVGSPSPRGSRWVLGLEQRREPRIERLGQVVNFEELRGPRLTTHHDQRRRDLANHDLDHHGAKAEPSHPCYTEILVLNRFETAETCSVKDFLYLRFSQPPGVAA